MGARWPPQLGAGISSVEITELYEVGHQRAALGIKIRFSNKVEAFEKLMRHLELFERNNSQVNIQVNLNTAPREEDAPTLEFSLPNGRDPHRIPS